jgi:hypothetical protein
MQRVWLKRSTKIGSNPSTANLGQWDSIINLPRSRKRKRRKRKNNLPKTSKMANNKTRRMMLRMSCSKE